MKLTIHNVGHGVCVSLRHDNGNVMLWDCGHSDNNRPSVFLPASGVTTIDYFLVANYDEDHISDLPDLRSKLNIRSLFRNKSINSSQLRQLKLKSGPISTAMNSMLDMIDSYTGGPLTPPPAFPNVSMSRFCNDYGAEFDDSNNISLVTFLQCGSTKFIIPGDLENAGWKGLLTKQSFISELKDVDVFLASHHGRENGYCEDVFKHCNPDVFVFSDSNIEHATQEMTDVYAGHAAGIMFNGKTRYVLTTRKDGSLTWTL